MTRWQRLRSWWGHRKGCGAPATSTSSHFAATTREERIVRVGHGASLPRGWCFLRYIATESLPYAPYWADVVLVAKVPDEDE